MSTATINKPRSRNEWDGYLLQLGLDPKKHIFVCKHLDELDDVKQLNQIRAELDRLGQRGLDPTGYLKYLRFGFEAHLNYIA